MIVKVSSLNNDNDKNNKNYENILGRINFLTKNKTHISEADCIQFTKCAMSSDDKLLKRLSMIGLRDIYLSGNYKYSKNVEKTLDYVGEICFSKIKDKKHNLDDYDSFIFDADKTIWECLGDFCAKDMVYPFKKEKDNVVVDSEGKKIKLKDDIKDILMFLKLKNREIGLISHSEKEDIPYEDQPVILLLKEFNILDFFNDRLVVSSKLPKSIFIPENKYVLFIDDDMSNIIEVVKNSNADGAKAEDISFNDEFMFDFDEDLEPVEVVKLRKGETINNFKNWIKSENEVIVQYDKDTLVKAIVKDHIKKTSQILNNSDNIEKKEKNKNISDKKLLARKNKISIEGLFVDAINESYWYKISKNTRDYIPVSEIPEKPKDGKEYELDHKKPLHKSKNNKKENLQWIEKDKHKKKSQEEGSFEYGGKDRHKKLKGEGETQYKEYQKNCGEKRQKSERERVGEKAYSKLQSERARKRWHGK